MATSVFVGGTPPRTNTAIISLGRRDLMWTAVASVAFGLPAAAVADPEPPGRPKSPCPDLPLEKSNGRYFTIYSPAPREAAMVQEICESLCLSSDIRVLSQRSLDLISAEAKILDGQRLIVVNPDFMALIAQPGSRDWRGFSILAHEVGHHVCGHLNRKYELSREIEADRFAGFVVGLFGGSREDATRLFDEVPGILAAESKRSFESWTRWSAEIEWQAPRDERRAASLEGWRKASDRCAVYRK